MNTEGPLSTAGSLPRSIRRGPPITITCECGERRYLHYGERWTCEKCGRKWSTLHIPREEYAALRRTQLRYRWIPLVVAAVVLVSLIALIVIGRVFGGILIAALAATAWGTYGRPVWKRRYLKAIENRPSWTIGPD